MIPLAHPETTEISKKLLKYDPHATIACTAGLLTAPHLHANTLRLELLVHLSVMHCAGRRKPKPADLGRWLNQYLENSGISSQEDPPEDAFILNICTPEGNRRIFRGIWNSSDYFLQVALDQLIRRKAPKECEELLGPAFALLKMSDSIADRLSLPRWHSEPSRENNQIVLESDAQVRSRARAVTFTLDDFDELDIEPNSLNVFVFPQYEKNILASETLGNTTLERRPLVQLNDEWIVALPDAISPAIRLYLLSELKKLRHLSAFQKALRQTQIDQIQGEGFFELRKNVESMKIPDSVPQPKMDLASWLLRYDSDKYLHIVLLHDSLEQIETAGLDSYLQYTTDQQDSLMHHVKHIADYCKSQLGYVEGVTLFIKGDMGRGLGLDLGDQVDTWQIGLISIPDLLLLAVEPGQPIERLLKLIKQKGWARARGVSFFNLSGYLNLYSYWRSFNSRIIPREMPVDPHTSLYIAPDIISDFRQEMRTLLDEHVAETMDGIQVRVRRFGYESYFEYLHRLPVYASLDHLKIGSLAAVIETRSGLTWLSAVENKDVEAIHDIAYQLWWGLLEVSEKIIVDIENKCPAMPRGIREIVLNFSKLKMPISPLDPKVSISPGTPKILFHTRNDISQIIFPPDFLEYFQVTENTGERLIVSSFAASLMSLLSRKTVEANNPTVLEVVDHLIPDSGLRFIHLFQTYNPVEYLLSEPGDTPVFIKQEDYAFNSLLLVDGCITNENESIIQGVDNCNDSLNKIVDKVWSGIRYSLLQLDRASVIRKALIAHEDVFKDREHWNRTVKALLAIHGKDEDIVSISSNREKERTEVAISARTLIEMAVCECPISGGRQLSSWDLDELLARVALLLTAANDSDAIKYELIEPKIHIHANGEYTVERSAYEEVMSQFQTGYFREKIQEAVQDYDHLYEVDKHGEPVDFSEVFESDFIQSFRIEYNISLEEIREVLAELLALAVEDESVVIETTMGTLRRRILDNRGLSDDTFNAFIRTFGLTHRPNWDIPPKGFTMKDIYPWRFSRRLSVVVRPLILFGNEDSDQVFYGLGGLRSAVGYLTNRAEGGQLPGHFFTSREMQQYLGKINHKKGDEFEDDIAEELRSRGWEARTKVKMSELGAPPSEAAGDIDVLVWKPTLEVMLIECKRLKLARTVAEIADIYRRFRGEAKDELDKHVRRINWIRENPACLQSIIGFTPKQDSIDQRLITSTHVHIRYLTSLPIPSAKIGTLEQVC